MCATTKKESKYNDFLAITLVHDRRSACVIHPARVDEQQRTLSEMCIEFVS